MADEDESLPPSVSARLRAAGRQLAAARRAYANARRATVADLPVDEDGQARIVCRRHAERRAVGLDGEGRPDCYDGEHPDCRGCLEDVRSGTIETW